MSCLPLVSSGTMFEARDRNATYRQSELMEGKWLSPSWTDPS